MKFEKRNEKINFLESEAYFLFNLKGYGIPKIIAYGRTGNYNLLIEELLGPSLFSFFELGKHKDRKQLLKDVCMISLQGLERLEYIHSKDIIHKDIKPHNFLIGLKDPNVIYLIDFGFSRKYRSSRTGKHIKFQNLKTATGSIGYISLNGNRGFELSRRDDLESFGYMIIYLATNNLPWMPIGKLNIDNGEKLKAVFTLKYSTTPEILCKDLPEEFIDYIKYVRKLDFEENPDYNYLKGLFISALSRNELKNDLLFSWIINKREELKEHSEQKKIMIEKRINFTIRKNCSQKRLYVKIKKSLEKGEKNAKKAINNIPKKRNNNLKDKENNNNNKYSVQKKENINIDNNNNESENFYIKKKKIISANVSSSRNINYFGSYKNLSKNNIFHNKSRYLDKNNNHKGNDSLNCIFLKTINNNICINNYNHKYFGHNRNDLNLMIDKRDYTYKTLNERKKLENNLMKIKLKIFGDKSRKKSPNNNKNNANTIGDSFLTTNKNITISLDEFIPMKNVRSKKGLINNVKIPINLNNKTYKNN